MDAETFLHDFARDSEALGFPAPPPEMQTQMVATIDYFADMASRPYPERSGAWAWWRGVRSALRSQDLGDSWRMPTKSMKRAWMDGRRRAHRLTLYRFDRWTCTCCGHWVRGPGKAHDPSCRQYRRRKRG